MKPEPLAKEKIIKSKVTLGDKKPTELCIKADVKSAVDLVLKEIEEKRKLRTVNKKKVEYFNPENPYYHLGINRGLEIAKDLIKKAFEGVM